MEREREKSERSLLGTLLDDDSRLHHPRVTFDLVWNGVAVPSGGERRAVAPSRQFVGAEPVAPRRQFVGA